MFHLSLQLLVFIRNGFPREGIKAGALSELVLVPLRNVSCNSSNLVVLRILLVGVASVSLLDLAPDRLENLHAPFAALHFR